MPPRVAYWAGSFEPEIEAVAAEVACLRKAFPGSVTWGVDARRWARFSWKRGFSVHPQLQIPFRAATWLLQRAFHINHLFGGPSDWFHLRAVARRPTLVTVALAGEPGPASLLNKVDRFVVEWPDARHALVKAGVASNRIGLVFPPVNLDRFSPSPQPTEPFTVLFASSPERSDWLSARGLDLLLDAAALRPRMQFRLLWRPWGDSLPEIRRWIQERSLSNVELVPGRCSDMAQEYANVHATVAPFRDIQRCKPAPNSIVESLAAGRPVVVTRCVGLAEVVDQGDAGLVCGDSPHDLAECLDRLQADWDAYSVRSRQLAERHFGRTAFIQAYSKLYEQLT